MNESKQLEGTIDSGQQLNTDTLNVYLGKLVAKLNTDQEDDNVDIETLIDHAQPVLITGININRLSQIDTQDVTV